MELGALTAISPVDGRYRNKVDELAGYFSEFGLIRYRVQVEIEYFISLASIPLQGLDSLDSARFADLRKIYSSFSISDAERIKEIEKTTNHDVKAVEYFIKEKFDGMGMEPYREYIHFGLTSQDINNTATPLSIKEAHDQVYLKTITDILAKLDALSEQWKDIAMLARTHGQPASPTRLGKEIGVFAKRIREQIKLMDTIPFPAKFGGATGNMNAHIVTYPNIDWHAFADKFVNENLGLDRSFPTTQIEHYDHLAARFDNYARINNILVDLARDFWTYISMDYFKQKIVKGEIGSSAMPHKVNPIDFENAEGNFGVANSIFHHLSAKLPVSRLQRDLTDSTVLRNVGVPIAHSLIGFLSLLKGLNKVELNEAKLKADLDNNWAVVAEAIQNILRRENYPNPYETLLELTRTGNGINEETIKTFIDGLEVSDEIKAELKAISPHNYTGR